MAFQPKSRADLTQPLRLLVVGIRTSQTVVIDWMNTFKPNGTNKWTRDEEQNYYAKSIQYIFISGQFMTSYFITLPCHHHAKVATIINAIKWTKNKWILGYGYVCLSVRPSVCLSVCLGAVLWVGWGFWRMGDLWLYSCGTCEMAEVSLRRHHCHNATIFRSPSFVYICFYDYCHHPHNRCFRFPFHDYPFLTATQFNRTLLEQWLLWTKRFLWRQREFLKTLHLLQHNYQEKLGYHTKNGHIR